MPLEELRHPTARGRRATGRWAALRERVSLWAATRRAGRLIGRDLGLMGVGDVTVVVKAVERKRGGTVITVQVPLPSGMPAFCVRRGDRQYMVVDSRTGEGARSHAVLCELLRRREKRLGEGGRQEMDEDALRLLLPGIKPQAALRVLAEGPPGMRDETGRQVSRPLGLAQ
ncbi:hypothetical protein [Streptomyces sp. NPDC055607]